MGWHQILEGQGERVVGGEEGHDECIALEKPKTKTKTPEMSHLGLCLATVTACLDHTPLSPRKHNAFYSLWALDGYWKACISGSNKAWGNGMGQNVRVRLLLLSVVSWL